MTEHEPFRDSPVVPIAVAYAPTRKGVPRWAVDTASGHRFHVWNRDLAQHMSDRRFTLVHVGGYASTLDNGTVWVTVDQVAFAEPVTELDQLAPDEHGVIDVQVLQDALAHDGRAVPTPAPVPAPQAALPRAPSFGVDERPPCRIPGCSRKVTPKSGPYARLRSAAIAAIRIDEQLCHDHATKLYAADRARIERSSSVSGQAH